MPVRLLQEAQVSVEAILAFPFLHLPLHTGRIGRQLKRLAITKPEVVVGLAFQEFDSFGLEGGVQIVECLSEKVGEEEEGRALIETLESR